MSVEFNFGVFSHDNTRLTIEIKWRIVYLGEMPQKANKTKDR